MGGMEEILDQVMQETETTIETYAKYQGTYETEGIQEMEEIFIIHGTLATLLVILVTLVINGTWID